MLEVAVMLSISSVGTHKRNVTGSYIRNHIMKNLLSYNASKVGSYGWYLMMCFTLFFYWLFNCLFDRQ